MKKCRGIEIEPGVFSGCDTRGGTLTDCPSCHGGGVETSEVVAELAMAETGLRLDRDYALADLLTAARMTIAGLVADSSNKPLSELAQDS